jgi:hypothetical protein
MRFLRHREVPEAEKKSSHPPLVMMVRNPRDEDAVEVRRHVLGDSPEGLEDAQPYVFAAGIRRDLLGDPDWIASAIMRHLRASLADEATVEMARERVTTDRLRETVKTILEGLGYVVSPYYGKDQEGAWTELRAWSRGTESEMPDIQIEFKIVEGTAVLREADRLDATQAFNPLQFYPLRGELIPRAERLLVCLAFSRGSTEESSSDEEAVGVIGSSSDSIVWRVVASESMVLGRGREIISAQEFSEPHRINVIVYRAEEGSSQR